MTLSACRSVSVFCLTLAAVGCQESVNSPPAVNSTVTATAPVAAPAVAPVAAAPVATPAAVANSTPVATSAPAATAPGAPAAKQAAKGPVKFSPADLELYVVKDGKAFVQVNLFPEIDALRSLDAAGQEAYLCRRAAKSLLEKGLSHKLFTAQNDFVVRLVVLKNLDEYGRPKWGDAAEVARLSANRPNLQTHAAEPAEKLDDSAAVSLFAEKKLNLDALNKVIR